MGDSMKAAREDEKEYLRLCRKFNEKPTNYALRNTFFIDYDHFYYLKDLEKEELENKRGDFEKAQKEEYLVLCKKYNEDLVYVRNEFGESQLDINGDHHNYLNDLNNGKRCLKCYICGNEKESVKTRKFKKTHLVDKDESENIVVRVNVCDECYMRILEIELSGYDDCIPISVLNCYLKRQGKNVL